MNSLSDRLGWLEADVRTLTERVRAAERTADSASWLDQNAKKAAERDRAFELEELDRKVRSLGREVQQHHDNLMALQDDAANAAAILGSHIRRHALWLRLLGLLSLAEAVAIAVLWRAV